MSKSLKNFTTIREALSRGDWTPRSLRVAFLLGTWNAGVEITEGLVKEGAGWEDKVNNFFLKAKSAAHNQSMAAKTQTNGAGDVEVDKEDPLTKALTKAQENVYKALTDSFDTKLAMQEITELITEYNSTPRSAVTDATTLKLATWVTEMVRVFGLDANPPPEAAGWSGLDIPEVAKPFVYPASALRDEVRRRAKSGAIDADELVNLSHQNEATSSQSPEALPYAEVLSQFQQAVRSLAESNAPPKDLLALCDNLRDVKLWDRGIYLEDAQEDNQPALVRLLDRELIRARQEKEQREREKQEAKKKKEREAKEEAERKAEQAKVDPKVMFRTEEYGEWDDEGFPTKDAKGEKLAKNQVKKLKKMQEAQQKAHEKWLKDGAK